jgi:type VI secretion system secreted protein Hcp
MIGLLAGARTALFAAASTILVALPFQASAADQVFLRFDGIQGSSVQAGHLNWMDVLSFSFGVDEAASFSGTVASGKPNFSTINVVKLADRADVPMLRHLLTGAHIPSGTLDIVGQVGATPESVAQVKLANAVITNVQTSGSGQTPVVSVSIAFEKIQLITSVYRPDGSIAGVESVTYDVLTNTVSVP